MVEVRRVEWFLEISDGHDTIAVTASEVEDLIRQLRAFLDDVERQTRPNSDN